MAVSNTAAGSYELHDPDVQLMLEVRDDNALAFEQLVERYQARLIAVLQHLTQRRDQAEDLAQEVFLRVFRARKRYEPGAKFSTWLFTIANNVASNSRRSLARRKEVHLVGAAGDSQAVQPLHDLALAASGLMPARQLDKRERVEIVRLAIESLPERQRMALLLAKFEHMSYADIGESMGLSVPATKSLLSRARLNLRVLLEPYLEDGSRPVDDTDAGRDT